MRNPNFFDEDNERMGQRFYLGETTSDHFSLDIIIENVRSRYEVVASRSLSNLSYNQIEMLKSHINLSNNSAVNLRELSDYSSRHIDVLENITKSDILFREETQQLEILMEVKAGLSMLDHFSGKGNEALLLNAIANILMKAFGTSFNNQTEVVNFVSGFRAKPFNVKELLLYLKGLILILVRVSHFIIVGAVKTVLFLGPTGTVVLSGGVGIFLLARHFIMQSNLFVISSLGANWLSQNT